MRSSILFKKFLPSILSNFISLKAPPRFSHFLSCTSSLEKKSFLGDCAMNTCMPTEGSHLIAIILSPETNLMTYNKMQGYKRETDKYQKKGTNSEKDFFFFCSMLTMMLALSYIYIHTSIKVVQQRLQDLTNQYCKLKMLKHFIFILIQNCTLGVQYKQMLDYD